MRKVASAVIVCASLFSNAAYTEELKDSTFLSGTPFVIDTEYNRDYHLSQVKAADAHKRGWTGAGQIVAVFDTGLNTAHSEFAGRIAGPGYDAVLGKVGVTSDVGWHGTFVSGIIAASRNGKGMEGVAYDAKLLPIRIANSDGSIKLPDQSLAAAIRYATTQKAGVYNNSWNSSAAITYYNRSYFDNALPSTLAAYRAAVNANGIVVFAAGNEGKAQPGLYAALPTLYPELTRGWIAAVATDSAGKIAGYSNRCGSTANWCMAAPGSGIVSTYGSGYGTGNGTSFAAPVISGAAAVLKQQWPYLTNQQVQSILFTTANKSGIYADKATYGQGLLDMEKATRPVGKVTVPTTKKVTAKKAPVKKSKAVLKKPFGYRGPGKGWSTRSASLMVLDEYNRAYEMDAAALFQSESSNFDSLSALRAFGDGMEVQNIGDARIAFDMTPGQPDGFSASATDRARLFIEAPVDAFTLNAGMNVMPALAFGAGPKDLLWGGALVDTKAAANPFFDLAEDAYIVAAETNLGSGLSFRFGGFTGVQASDPAEEFTLARDPVYSPDRAAVTGAVAELEWGMDKGSKLAFGTGMVREDDTVLGSPSDGAASLGSGASTVFASVSATADLGDGFQLFGGFESGWTMVDRAEDSLVGSVSTLTSNAFRLGVIKTDIANAGDRATLMFSQPLRVTGGGAHLEMPVSRDMDGNVFYTSSDMDLSASGRELDIQAFYETPLETNQTLSAGALLRIAPGNQSDTEAEGVMLARYKLKF